MINVALAKVPMTPQWFARRALLARLARLCA